MRQLGWGLIGCGDIARQRVAPALAGLGSCRLIAVNRANFALAEPFARDFGVTQWYERWTDLKS